MQGWVTSWEDGFGGEKNSRTKPGHCRMGDFLGKRMPELKPGQCRMGDFLGRRIP